MDWQPPNKQGYYPFTATQLPSLVFCDGTYAALNLKSPFLYILLFVFLLKQFIQLLKLTRKRNNQKTKIKIEKKKKKALHPSWTGNKKREKILKKKHLAVLEWHLIYHSRISLNINRNYSIRLIYSYVQAIIELDQRLFRIKMKGGKTLANDCLPGKTIGLFPK